MSAPALEEIVARVRARLDRTRAHLRAALAGQEARTLEWWGPARYQLSAEGQLLETPSLRAWPLMHAPGEVDLEFIEGEGYRPLATSAAWPLEIAPADVTVAEALARLDAEADQLAADTAADLHRLIALVPAKLRAAVLAREELLTQWPWLWPPLLDPLGAPTDARRPSTFHVAQLLEMLRAFAPLQLGELAPGAWPLEVAPADVIAWVQDAARRKAAAPWLERARASGYHLIPLAVLYATVQAVERDRDRRAMAIDAGRPHHDLLMGWRDLPKDTRKPRHVTTINDRIELLAPGGGCVQLTLDLDGQGSPGEALITALREMRGWKGLRHWAAVQKLLSVDGGRQGWVRWTLNGHLDALGVSVKNRSKAGVRVNVARQVEAFTKIEIAVYAEDGTLRTRRPILLVGAKYDRLKGSAWELDGMQLTINPLLYAGVREASGKLGRNWHPAPVELAAVNEREHPYTIALGLILPIRWRLALEEGHDHLALTGERALRLAGITYKPSDRRWLAKNGAHAWEALERDLAELARIGGLGRLAWDAADTPRTLAGRLHLWPAAWQRDRTIHAVRPRELPPGPAVLTGAELKAWRDRRGLTQTKAAETLHVGRRTIARAEAHPAEPLSTALAGKMREAGA